MSDRLIPLSDPRRRRNGNRTIRISLDIWKGFQEKHTKTWQDANSALREICRVNSLHLHPDDPSLGGPWPSSYSRITSLLHDLVHGLGDENPIENRQKYASIIRQVIEKQREARLRTQGFLRPGQSYCSIP